MEGGGGGEVHVCHAVNACGKCMLCVHVVLVCVGVRVGRGVMEMMMPPAHPSPPLTPLPPHLSPNLPPLTLHPSMLAHPLQEVW